MSGIGCSVSAERNQVPMRRLFLTLGLAAAMVFAAWFHAALAMAEVLELKNGRRIDYESFSEEGDRIRIYLPSGSFVISKDEIHRLRAGDHNDLEMSVRSEFPPSEFPAAVAEVSLATPVRSSPGKSGPRKMVREDPRRRKEEKKLRAELLENARRIRSAMNDYLRASKRGKEPCSESCRQEITARVAELKARQLDALYDPQKARGVSQGYLRPSPFVGLPPEKVQAAPAVESPRVQGPLPAYTPQEEQFSKLSRRIEELYTQRDALIEKMRRSGFETGEP